MRDTVKAKKILEVQGRTYADMVRVLNRYGKCNLERPTGFGKTALFMRLAGDNPDKRFLYVYDSSTVLDQVKGYEKTNVNYISYNQLSRKINYDENRKLLLSGYDYVIFDESHLMGGHNIKSFLEQVLPELVESGVKIVGGTATPLRTDLVDVTETFFDDLTVFDYDLKDAFDDGIFEEPVYTLMWYDHVKINDFLKRKQFSKFIVKKVNQLEHAYANRLGASEVYRSRVIETYGCVPEYMQFIVFYPTIAAIRDNESKLVKEFSDAFPEQEINVLRVSSALDHKDGYAELVLPEKPGTIDLVLCVDMLNQGYHSNKLTGIIMNRATISNIVFTQQIGRCLSVGTGNKTIIFDNVANFFKDPLDAFDAVQKLQEDGKVSGGGGVPRGFRRLVFKVRGEDLEVVDWCRRLLSINNATDVALERARRLYEKFSAPMDYLEKEFSIPADILSEYFESVGVTMDE